MTVDGRRAAGGPSGARDSRVRPEIPRGRRGGGPAVHGPLAGESGTPGGTDAAGAAKLTPACVTEGRLGRPGGGRRSWPGTATRPENDVEKPELPTGGGGERLGKHTARPAPAESMENSAAEDSASTSGPAESVHGSAMEWRGYRARAAPAPAASLHGVSAYRIWFGYASGAFPGSAGCCSGKAAFDCQPDSAPSRLGGVAGAERHAAPRRETAMRASKPGAGRCQ